MNKELKKELLNMLQDISYGHDDGSFWKAWSTMHKFLWEMPEEDEDNYYEIYVEDDEGLSVHDTAWDLDDAKRLADRLKPLYPHCEVGVIEYRYAGVAYVSKEGK